MRARGTGDGSLVTLRLPESRDLAVESVNHRLVLHLKRILELNLLTA